MPSVPIVRPAAAVIRPNTMTIKVDGETAISLITSPVKITGTAGTWKVSETERPGRQPITQASAPGLRTVQFSHQIAALNPYMTVEHLVQPLRRAAERKLRVQFFNGGMLSSGIWWWVRSLEIAEDEKGAANQTSRATLTWDCVEANRVSAVELTKTGVKPGNRDPGPVGTPGPSNPIDKIIEDARNR